MLKPYDKPEDIPEPLREHYSRRDDGKYHADIPNDHPAVKHNATLLSEKNTAESKARDLESQLESAKASGLPRGHVAVPKSDADLLTKLKEHGTADEVVTKLTKYPELEKAETRRARQEHLRKVGKAMGWDAEKTALLLEKEELPETDVRDGKVVAKVKQADGSLVEKPFSEVVSGDERLSALTAGLSGRQSGASRGNGGDPPPAGTSNVYERAKEAGKASAAQANEGGPGWLAKRFSGAASNA